MRSHASIAAPNLAQLRRLTERMTGRGGTRDVLPFGIPEMDAALPGGGLAIGAVHEISEVLRPGGRAVRRLAPALARVGLHPDRVIYCETWKDAEILPSMEEGLRHPGVAGVVGELTRLPLTPSRRLQLAAETSKVTALVVRRSGTSKQEPNAATSRWRVFIDALPRPGHRHGPRALACRTPALPPLLD